MTKKDKVALNRSKELSAIDEELDSALSKLSDTTQRIETMLSDDAETPAEEGAVETNETSSTADGDR